MESSKVEVYIKFFNLLKEKERGMMIDVLDHAVPNIENEHSIWGKVTELGFKNDLQHHKQCYAAWNRHCKDVHLSVRSKVVSQFQQQDIGCLNRNECNLHELLENLSVNPMF